MLLTDRLRDVAAEAAAIKKSLESFDPRAVGAGFGSGREAGYRPIPGQHMRRVAECAKLIAEVQSGTRPSWHLREAMSTSDFPYLFGDVMYRQMMGSYATMKPLYPQYFKIRKVKDLRTINMYNIEGGDGLLTALKQYEPYPETVFTEGTKTLAVGKYGRRYGLNLEMLINDDMGAFNDRPQLMASGARFSEEYLATQTCFDANGPHASFFTSGNANIVTSNAVFGLAGFQTAFTQLGKKLNSEGVPIIIEMATLVVGPALEVAANNLFNASELRIVVGDTTIITQNWMRNKLKIVVNPMIPLVVTAGTVADTCWMLVANSNNPANRPAFNFGLLQGREQPQLFIKDPDARALGGGEISPAEGSFDNDSIDYKVRHFFGAGQGDPNMAIASKGTGS